MKTIRLRRLAAVLTAAACFGALVNGSPASARANTAGEYVSLPSPSRILDTRTANGVSVAGALGPQSSLDLQVTGRGGVPATGVLAVVMNVTVAAPTDSSFLSVWPTGEGRPTVSSLNFVPGQTVPNLVTVKVGTGGKVSMYNQNGSTHVLADVVGFYDDASITGGWYNPLTPARVLDTRTGNGVATAGPLGPRGTMSLQVTGRGGVPDAAQVSAVVLNVTAVDPSAAGYVSVWPGGAQPNVSNLNFAPGAVIANLVIVGVSSTGTVSFFNETGNTNLVADVVGWFDKTGSAGLVFTPISPVRAVDTRTPTPDPIGADQGPWAPPVSGAALNTSVVRAVVMNVTATDTTADSYFTVYPANVTPRPEASNLNWKAGQTVPNLVMSPVSPTGSTTVPAGLTAVYNFKGQANLIMDVVGYFAAAPAA